MKHRTAAPVVPIRLKCQGCDLLFTPYRFDNVDYDGFVRVDCPACDLVHLIGERRWHRGDLPQEMCPSVRVVQQGESKEP